MDIEDIEKSIEKEAGSVIQETTEYNSSRFYIRVDKDSVRDIARVVSNDLGGRLATITGHDKEDGFHILYHYVFDSEGFICTFRVVLDEENPAVDSIHDIIPGASAIEREIRDFLGVELKGEKTPAEFLKFEGLPDDYYPLRQDAREPFENE